VAFFPYLSFPINDERKTGFLMPGISNSSDLGWDLEIPYYLNLAPNYDATLTPRLTQEHGELLQSEFRYLFGSHLGGLHYDYLERDRQSNERRWFGDWQHTGQLAPSLRINTLYRDLSDNQYLTDFDPISGGDDVDHLERRADLSYANRWFNGLVRWQDFLTVNDEIAPAAFPYKKLPEVNARLLPLQFGGLTLGTQSQWVRFAHDDRDPVGDRQHHELTLGVPLNTSWGHLHPQLIHRESSYDLDLGDNPASLGDDRFDRSLTGYSIDGGMVFERMIDWGGKPLNQTLEPRLFYLYTPFEAQDEIPRFDTGLQTFSYAQLFRSNRFTGPDRIGDAQQLAASLSTQIRRADNGRELLRASIGRLFYFRDREVTLTGNRDDIGTENYSDIAAEARLQPLPYWSLRAESIYSTELDRVEKGKAGIQYRRDNSHLLNLSLEFDQTDTQTRNGTEARLQQYLISGRWQLHRNWHLLARRYYSLEENHLIDSLAGLEYDTCCWALRLVHTDEREALTDDPTDTELKQAIYLQLELKGLGGLNDRLRNVVQERVDGYYMPRY
jgi:LPS-assembly protein